jgi:hypothetical protein
MGLVLSMVMRGTGIGAELPEWLTITYKVIYKKWVKQRQ